MMPITMSGSVVSTGTSRERPGTSASSSRTAPAPARVSAAGDSSLQEVFDAQATTWSTGVQPSRLPSSAVTISAVVSPRAAVSSDATSTPAGVRAGLSARLDLRSGVSCAPTAAPGSICWSVVITTTTGTRIWLAHDRTLAARY